MGNQIGRPLFMGKDRVALFDYKEEEDTMSRN